MHVKETARYTAVFFSHLLYYDINYILCFEHHLN